jgi:hypothetical protein
LGRNDDVLTKPSQHGSRAAKFRIGENALFPTIACVLAGVLLGYAYTYYPWKEQVFVVGAICFLTLTWIRPEYSLYLLFMALVMTTDAIPDDAVGVGEHFVIEEIKLPGLPSALNVVLLIIFSVKFLRLYLIDRKTSVIPLKYLFVYTIVLIIALTTGAKHPKATSDMLRLEFMKMLFPVLCFYASVNILNDYDKVRRMMWVLFMICVIKSAILDVYYLTGRGFPFGDYRIVSYDTGELMAFVVMLLFVIMMISYQKITGIRAWLLALSSTPLLFAVLFSFRRGHWLGMLSSMGLLYLWSPRVQRARLRPYLFTAMLFAFPVICLFILAGALFPRLETASLSRMSSRFSTVFDPNQDSNRHHLYESIQTMKDIMESPFFGLGLASEHSPVDENLGGWVEDKQPLNIVHNTFIYLWMKTGFLGFILFIWSGYIYVKEIVRYQKSYRSSGNWPLTVSISSAIGIWFVNLMTGAAPFYFHQSYLIAVFSAMMISLIRLETMRKPGYEQ